MKLLRAIGVAAAVCAFNAASIEASEPSWITTWMASPQRVWDANGPLPTNVPETLNDTTVRQILRVSLGGERLRVVVSNAYGERPLIIGAASVAKSDDAAAVDPETLQRLTFGGLPSIRVPPGAPVVSDPISLGIDDLDRIAISLYLPNPQPVTTFHWDGREEAFMAPGNAVMNPDLQARKTTTTRLFLGQVQVWTPNQGSVVILGDSITDGNGATIGADTRWPDFLAERFAEHRVSVLNAGISGARLLTDGMGSNALARFDRDILSLPALRSIVALIGINDIAWPGTAFDPYGERPDVERLQQGFRQLRQRAQLRGVRFFGATLLPFEGALSDTSLSDYYSPEKDKMRHQINQWIRENGEFDDVLNFDRGLRDPDHPNRLRAKYDSGDHLHPGDDGNREMARIAAKVIAGFDSRANQSCRRCAGTVDSVD